MAKKNKINIILEGTKGTGKSTISKYFMLKGFTYKHSSKLTKNDYDYHMGIIKDERDMIIDRFSVGELVYSMIYGREPKLKYREMLETVHQNNTILVVLFDGSDDNLYSLNRILQRDGVITKEDSEVNKDANDLFQVFEKTLKVKNLMVYDISVWSSGDIIKDIEAIVGEVRGNNDKTHEIISDDEIKEIITEE